MLAGRGGTRNQTTNKRSCVFSESEFVAAVTVANQPNFNAVQFPVNPGQSTLFPWLSKMAQNYEKYRFVKLGFRFKREVSEFATNGQVGKVMMMFDQDAGNGPPGTKQVLEDWDPHSDGMPCENIYLSVPPIMLRKFIDGFYVRTAGLPGAADIKTFDVGNFYIATQGIVNNVEVGELHVDYTVELFSPVLNQNQTVPTNNQVSWFQSAAVQTVTTATPATSLNATATANGIGVVNTAGSFVPPVGNYNVDMRGSFADSQNEAYIIIMDFQKNGTSVYPALGSLSAPTSDSAGVVLEKQSLSSSVFVTANGTDAFTQVITMTGATGTLTCLTGVRWTAV